MGLCYHTTQNYVKHILPKTGSFYLLRFLNVEFCRSAYVEMILHDIIKNVGAIYEHFMFDKIIFYKISI